MPEFYNGAIDFQPVEEEDQRPKINAACEPGCSSAWKNYLACGERIEAKVGPYCSLYPHPTSHAAIQCGPARSLLRHWHHHTLEHRKLWLVLHHSAFALVGLLLVRRAREIVARGTWTTTGASTSAL